MKALEYAKIAWKIVSSRPALFLGLAACAWLFWQEWSLHKITAAARATHYTAETTREAKTWETVRFICGGGPVNFAVKPSKDEVKRYAEEYGLTLSEKEYVEVPGPERRVEVPVYVTESGLRVRLLGNGEKILRPMPWGGTAIGGVDEHGDLFLEPKPTPEPFTEKLAASYMWFGLFYEIQEKPDVFGGSKQPSGGPMGEIGGGYRWRRYGRWTIAPAGGVGWSESVGFRGRLGLIFSRDNLPLRLRVLGE